MTFLVYLIVVCWACWLGAAIFFSFALIPALFRIFPSEKARSAVQDLFPTYYLFCMVAGGAASLACLLFRADPRLTVPLVIGVTLVGFARQRVLPKSLEARARDDQTEIASLHVLSVRLNMVVLALLLLAGWIVAL